MDDPDSCSTPAPQPSDALSDDRIYHGTFWLMYFANWVFVTANVMTFRFAELVHHLGGTEHDSGTIVSFGVGAAITIRLFLGRWIDHHGVRLLWIIGAMCFALGAASFLLVEDISLQIYFARAVFMVGLSIGFTCSTVKILQLVPEHRRTEAVGNLGSSGFLGFIGGSQIADWMFHAVPDVEVRFTWLFGTASVLGLVYLLAVVVLTRRDTHVQPRETPNGLWLMWKYWPGMIAVVGLCVGLAYTATSVFLTRFATHRGLVGIGTFFTTYAISAFVFRVACATLSNSIGRRRMILAGLAGHTIGMCLLTTVTSDLGFILPALFAGFGHAQLFPAVVSLGTESFPPKYRGTAATLVLGFFDLGGVIFAPAMGTIIDAYDGGGFVPMYYSCAAVLTTVGVVYWYRAFVVRANVENVESVRSREEQQAKIHHLQTGDVDCLQR